MRYHTMRNTTLIILFILLHSCLYAQNRTVKAYINGTVSPFSGSYNYNNYLGYNQRMQLRDYVFPSFAYQWSNKKKNYHEIELNRINISEDDNQVEFINPATGVKEYMRTQKVVTTIIAARYEYIINLAKKKKWLVQPGIGFGAMPYYSRYNSIPYVSSSYPISTTTAGIRHTIIPRINIALSNNLLLDVNIPLTVLDMGYSYQRIMNPTLPGRAQKYGIVDIGIPKYYTARIGLGLKI